MDFIFKDLINSKSSLAFHGHLIEDTKLLVSHFSCINFPHVRHQENVVVHHLSRRAILLPILLIWMEDIYIYIPPYAYGYIVDNWCNACRLNTLLYIQNLKEKNKSQ